MSERSPRIIVEQERVANALTEFGNQSPAHKIGVDILQDISEGTGIRAGRCEWTYRWGFIGETTNNKGTPLYLALDENLGVTLSIFEESEDAERFVRGNGTPGIASVSLSNNNGFECKIEAYDGLFLDLGDSQGEVLDVLVKIRDSFRVATDKS